MRKNIFQGILLLHTGSDVLFLNIILHRKI